MFDSFNEILVQSGKAFQNQNNLININTVNCLMGLSLVDSIFNGVINKEYDYASPFGLEFNSICRMAAIFLKNTTHNPNNIFYNIFGKNDMSKIFITAKKFVPVPDSTKLGSVNVMVDLQRGFQRSLRTTYNHLDEDSSSDSSSLSD